jgi:hypothetical protein
MAATPELTDKCLKLHKGEEVQGNQQSPIAESRKLTHKAETQSD